MTFEKTTRFYDKSYSIALHVRSIIIYNIYESINTLGLNVAFVRLRFMYTVVRDRVVT